MKTYITFSFDFTNAQEAAAFATYAAAFVPAKKVNTPLTFPEITQLAPDTPIRWEGEKYQFDGVVSSWETLDWDDEGRPINGDLHLVRNDTGKTVHIRELDADMKGRLYPR